MSTQQWIPPNRGIGAWTTEWLRGFRGSSPRTFLAHQLKYIRSAHGIDHASGFLRYVKSIGEYPGKK